MPPPSSFLSEVIALFGQPVAENPTQYMHEQAFAASGLNWRYVTLEVPRERLADAVTGMRAMNFAGANCTIPHKIAVLPLLDEITPTARKIGAVNTVIRQADGRYLGENTDGKGFIRSAVEAGADLRGSRAVILGAGGAARAIAFELVEMGAAHLTIVNRAETRGTELVRDLRERAGAQAEYRPWTGDFPLPPDTQLVINATSIALAPDVDALVPLDYSTLRPGMLACDVIPNPPDTPFLQQARGRGVATLDGLGMLVYQGAIAFEQWTGHDAPIPVMRAALEEVLAGS